MNFLAEFKQACHLSRIHEGATLWLFGNFMAGPALASFKTLLILFSNDVYTQQGSITSYEKIVNHMRRLYATDALIAKADENPEP